MAFNFKQFCEEARRDEEHGDVILTYEGCHGPLADRVEDTPFYKAVLSRFDPDRLMEFGGVVFHGSVDHTDAELFLRLSLSSPSVSCSFRINPDICRLEMKVIINIDDEDHPFPLQSIDGERIKSTIEILLSEIMAIDNIMMDDDGDEGMFRARYNDACRQYELTIKSLRLRQSTLSGGADRRDEDSPKQPEQLAIQWDDEDDGEFNNEDINEVDVLDSHEEVIAETLHHFERAQQLFNINLLPDLEESPEPGELKSKDLPGDDDLPEVGPIISRIDNAERRWLFLDIFSPIEEIQSIACNLIRSPQSAGKTCEMLCDKIREDKKRHTEKEDEYFDL